MLTVFFALYSTIKGDNKKCYRLLCFASLKTRLMSQGGLLSKMLKLYFSKYVFYFISYAIEFQSLLTQKVQID